MGADSENDLADPQGPTGGNRKTVSGEAVIEQATGLCAARFTLPLGESTSQGRRGDIRGNHTS